ncbi:hypothetical protein ACNKHM_22250 [Shigella sonnei]
MTLVTIATIVYWMNPAGNPTVDMICMIVIGFLIYGPVMLIGLHALELAPKRQVRRRVLPGCLVTWAVWWRRARLLATPWTSSAGWRLYGNHWRQLSGGYLVDCCDDSRKTSP